MKRFISFSICIIILLSSFIVPTMAAAGDLTFTVGSSTAQPGEDVLIPISVTNNNNALDVIAVTVTFDSTRLEWQDLGTYVPGNATTHPWTHGGFIPFLSNPGSIGTNSVNYYFMDQNGVYVESGTLVTLRLHVKGNAPAGDAAISLTFTSVGDSGGALNPTQYNNEAGKVTVDAGGSTPNLTLSANSWNPTAAGGSTTISVTSNIVWSASSDATTWLTVSPPSGSNNGSLTLSAQANTGSSRTGIITVAGSGVTQTIMVTQEGPVATADLTFTVGSAVGNAGEDVLVPITVTNNLNALDLVTVVVTFDNSRLEWQDLGTYVPGNTATHPWTHGGFIPFLSSPGSIGANSVTFYFMDQNGVYVENGTLITLKLRVKDDAPVGDAAITLSFISVGDLRGSLNSSQYNNEAGKVAVGTGGSTQNLTLSTNSWNPTAAGGSTTISVASNVAWSVSSNAMSWLTVSPSSGSNNGSLTLTAQANTGSSRTGIITVTGGGITQTVSVNQDGDSGSQDTLTFTVVSTKARSGEYVELPIQISENPGVAQIRMEVTLSEDVEWNYDPATYGTNPATWPFISSYDVLPISGRPTGTNLTESFASIYFAGDGGNSNEDGTLVTLKLKVKEEASAGEKPITVNVITCRNEMLSDVAYKVVEGKVTVVNFIYGDVNGDGIVDDLDHLILTQYINGWSVPINAGADVNGDGKVDDLDHLILTQYINGWLVILGPA